MRKILVVVDMQNDFVDGALGTEEAQAIAPKVVEKIRGFDGSTVVATYDTHQENYLSTQEGKNLPVPHCVKGTDGWKLAPAVQAALAQKKQDAVIYEYEKPTFGSVDLGSWLRSVDKNSGIDEVVLVGLCTDICVISNALLIKAFLPETKVTVDASCCAGVSPETHRNALAAMKVCQINIENWEDSPS